MNPTVSPARIETSGAFVPGEQFMLPAIGSGVLDGTSFAVKDLIDIEGHITGGGNPDWRANAKPALQHASAVRKLLRAGATLVGKTVTDELAFSLEGVNAHYGTPVNPRDAGALPGGSSSGSAVATATGLVDFALGTDTGGSVRVPAAFCGVYGFRPSWNAVPAKGVVPFAPSYDTIGWFARDPELLARVGDVLLQKSARHPIRRIALVEDALDHVDRNVAGDIAVAADRIVNAPAVRLFDSQSFDDTSNAYQILQGLEIKINLGPILKSLRPRFSPDIDDRFSGALARTDEEAEMAIKIRERLRDKMGKLCPPGTALIMPVSPHRQLSCDLSDDALGAFYQKALGLNAIAGHCGLPQVQMALQGSGPEISFAIIAAKGADRDLLEYASTIALARRVK